MAGYIPSCGEESPGIGHETGKVTISAACGSFVAESRCGGLADQRWSFHWRLLCSWPYKRSLFRSNTLKALRKQNWEVGVWMVGWPSEFSWSFVRRIALHSDSNANYHWLSQCCLSPHIFVNVSQWWQRCFVLLCLAGTSRQLHQCKLTHVLMVFIS